MFTDIVNKLSMFQFSVGLPFAILQFSLAMVSITALVDVNSSR